MNAVPESFTVSAAPEVLVRVKICGLTCPADCLAVNDALPDYAGFVFSPGRRQIKPENAAGLIRILHSDILPIGIFVDETDDFMARAVHLAGLRGIQLHSPAVPGRIGRLRRLLPAATRIWQCLAVPLDMAGGKARESAGFIIKEFQSLAARSSEQELPDAWLLDSCRQGQTGGTGDPFRWSDFYDFYKTSPFILAGGLSPANIGTALEQLHPAVVDCSSGVETDGRKDPLKIALFCRLVREFNVRHSLADHLTGRIGGASHD